MRNISEPEKEANAFNTIVNVGDTVSYTEVLGISKPTLHTTRTPAMVLSGHTSVVWLSGKNGCVVTAHCLPVPRG
jgi:hypothetical protein